MARSAGRSALAFAVVLAFGAGASVVAAQPADEDPEAAERHYKAGKAAHERGDLKTAAEEYKKAHALYPDPVLLYNLGQVFRLMGQSETAIDYYKRYVDADPEGQGVDKARRYIEVLEAAGDKEPEAGTEPAPKFDPVETPGDTGDPPVDSSPPVEQSPAFDPPTGQIGADVDPGRGLRYGGIATGALGAVAIVVGVAYGARASSLSDELSDPNRSTWTDDDLRKFEQGESAERNAIIFTSAGAALLVGGAALYALGASRGKTAEPDRAGATAAPVLGPNSVGFAVTGRF